jgi:hypothetical protein
MVILHSNRYSIDYFSTMLVSQSIERYAFCTLSNWIGAVFLVTSQDDKMIIRSDSSTYFKIRIGCIGILASIDRRLN